jgi:predicted nucleic acid-binding protein
LGNGPRYNGDDNAVGAQTERPGAAKAGEGSAWRRELTGRLSLFPSHFHAGAAASSQRRGMLTNDALRVALMQANAWTSIASHATDFDRVPGITRYAPV